MYWTKRKQGQYNCKSSKEYSHKDLSLRYFVFRESNQDIYKLILPSSRDNYLMETLKRPGRKAGRKSGKKNGLQPEIKKD